MECLFESNMKKEFGKNGMGRVIGDNRTNQLKNEKSTPVD